MLVQGSILCQFLHVGPYFQDIWEVQTEYRWKQYKNSHSNLCTNFAGMLIKCLIWILFLELLSRLLADLSNIVITNAKYHKEGKDYWKDNYDNKVIEENTVPEGIGIAVWVQHHQEEHCAKDSGDDELNRGLEEVFISDTVVGVSDPTKDLQSSYDPYASLDAKAAATLDLLIHISIY